MRSSNASMILSGMGPADQLKTDAGKLFAGCYALYSGLVIVLASGHRAGPRRAPHPASLPRRRVTAWSRIASDRKHLP